MVIIAEWLDDIEYISFLKKENNRNNLKRLNTVATKHQYKLTALIRCSFLYGRTWSA